jgi:FkbM family methyltransferase
MACDYAINPMLVDAGLTLPKDVLLDHRFRGMSAERVYNLLEEEEEQWKLYFPPMRGKQYAQALHSRLKWTNSVRPMAVGAFLADRLAPDRRTVITTKSGLRYFVDPLSNLGEVLVRTGEYEPETEQMFRDLLRTGDAFLDVGANEGYFTALAASLVGERGYVAAVEPQGKLCDIIEINVALNGEKATVVHGVLGGVKGQPVELFLYPSLNTGASSILRKPKLYRNVEKTIFVNPEELLGDRPHFDLVKVDVEGFEGKVVDSLEPMLQAGKVRLLVLDYHASILAANGVEPSAIESKILAAGMSLDGGSPDYQGYRIYRMK